MQHQTQPTVIRIQPGSLQSLMIKASFFAAPDLTCQRRLHITAQPKHLGHFAQRTFAPIGDHRCRQTGPLAPIFCIDILNHLFAAFMFKININIRWLAARLADKPFKQRLRPRWINSGDAQTVTYRRICRRTAPLTQNTAPTGKSHNVKNGQEIWCKLQFFNQRQFMLKIGFDPVINTVRKAFFSTLPGMIGQLLHRRTPPRRQLIWIFIRQIIK